MQISFFEEFPTENNLKKLKLISWPTKLYVAATSLKEFKEIKSDVKNKNVKKVVYWPILNVNEGYWLSPWTKRKALLRTFNDLKEQNVALMWDAELPKNRKLLITEMFKYFGNKRLIKQFFNNYQGKIYTSEYFLENRFLKDSLKNNCLSFDPNEHKNTPIKMMYTSVHHWMKKDFIVDKLTKYQQKYNGKLSVGLGTIAKGMAGNEPKLPVRQLERDLRICDRLGIKEVVIFRLGGLNKSYLKAIKKFT